MIALMFARGEWIYPPKPGKGVPGRNQRLRKNLGTEESFCVQEGPREK